MARLVKIALILFLMTFLVHANAAIEDQCTPEKYFAEYDNAEFALSKKATVEGI